MALSVILINPTSSKNTHMLYDSESQSSILQGTQEEMFQWKHSMETAQQQVANIEHLNALKEQYLQQLLEGGNTKEQAELFLKKQMPFLYQ